MVITRRLRVRSLALGVVGMTDIVEFIKGHPFPVEYKRGDVEWYEDYKVQLCCYAMCLEEMLSITIHTGSLYFGKSKRRIKISFDQGLRELSVQSITGLRLLIQKGITPIVRYENKCENCSVISVCLPKTINKPTIVQRYLSSAISEKETL